MKITGHIEQIFAQAVALEQSGGLRNTIYAIDREIYILSFDHSFLLRFGLKKTESPFSSPISFRANDYDSEEFYEEDGKIIFVTEKAGFTRKKSCGTPDISPESVQQVFMDFQGEPGQMVELHRDLLSLLDPELSHVEFSGTKKGGLSIVQRNIYSGGIIEITRTPSEGFISSSDPIVRDFGPIAIKTGDLNAAFAFQDVLEFDFPDSEDREFIRISSTDKIRRDTMGIIGCCIYDEIIEMKEASHGRKKQEVRRNK